MSTHIRVSDGTVFLNLILMRAGLRKPEGHSLQAAAAAAAVTANGIIVRAVAYAKQENGERREIKEMERDK